ncbi:MAG: hypothetical protein ACK46X_07725 [Candidatus Sericytochromatia bacterium]
MKRSQNLFVSLSLVSALSAALAGCSVPALNPAQVKSLVHQAAVLLKAIDEGGLEVSYGKDNILGVTVDGKTIQPTFDENGQLLLNIEAGQEKNVELRLKDGQTVQMPLRAEAADFAGGKRPLFEACVMPGEDGKPLQGEVRRPGQGGQVQDLFRAKAIRIDLDKAELRNDQLRRLYIGGFQVPRQSFFVEDGDLFIHEANLWVIQQAKAGMGGVQPPQGQPGLQQPGMQPPPQGQPGTMPPPPQQPGGTQPKTLLQLATGTQPPPPPPGGMQPPPPGGMQPPPPGGMQPPPPGGMQPPPGGMQPPPQQGQPGMQQPAKPVTFRLVVQSGEGRWGVVTIEAAKTPNPIPMAQPGTTPVNTAQKPPFMDKADLKVSTSEVTDLGKFEQEVVKITKGNFLPPMPPPGGMQPPPGGQPGMQPPPPQGQPGTQPPPPGQPGTQPPPPGQPGTQPPPPQPTN